MKGIHSTQLCCHISFLSFLRLTNCFFSSRGRLQDSRKRRLFCLHIQHTTRCLFERRTPVSSSEAAVCEFCLSISLQYPKNFSKQATCSYVSWSSDERMKTQLTSNVEPSIILIPVEVEYVETDNGHKMRGSFFVLVWTNPSRNFGWFSRYSLSRSIP